jgi:hypothetical protein
MITTSTSDVRELDHRSSDGLEITLFWSTSTNHVFVVVKDEHQGASIEIQVDPAHARDSPGCGLQLPELDAPTPADVGASPAC